MDLSKNPLKTVCTTNTIYIEWQKQHGEFNNYIVKYKTKRIKEEFIEERTSDCNIQMSNLKNNTLYEIKVFVEDINGDESFFFKAEGRTLVSIASKLTKEAVKILEKPAVYRLCPVETTNHSEGIQIREFFSDVNNKEERFLLLLGASESGKSTLVDAIINYITGVSFADNFRFKITDEIKKEEEDVVCYKIRCLDGFKIEFSLNIIDVPGFESGYNDKNYKRLFDLFQTFQPIGAACLVVQSFCRLTEEHRCIFNNILSIFGNDINHIIPLITFDDGGDLNVLRSLKDAKVPFVEDLQLAFNNSQLFTGNEHIDIWTRRQKTMEKLFGKPTVFCNWPVEKTREVLKARNMLQHCFEDTKSLKRIIEEKENILKDYEMRKTSIAHQVRDVNDVKVDGRDSRKKRITVQNVQSIEDQTYCEKRNTKETLHKDTRALIHGYKAIYEDILKHVEYIKKTALVYEDHKEMEIVRKYKETH